MRASLYVWLLGLMIPFPVGQKTQPPAPAKGSIEGVVLKAGTGDPLKKAWITLNKAQGRGREASTMTDGAGRFALQDVEPGQYTLRVNRNGYVSQQYGQRGPGSPGTILTLGPGQTIRNLEIRMTPAAVISGHVYDEDGEPVPMVRVSVLQYYYREANRELSPQSDGFTNDLGEYRVYGLPPGRYYVSAQMESWERPAVATVSGRTSEGDNATEQAYAPTYYPGTNDVARASMVELRAGDDLTGLDIMLLPTRAVRVRGRILNIMTGKAVNRAMVALMPRDTGVRSYTFSAQNYFEDPQGNFELRGVVPGAYVLVTSVWEDGQTSYHARVPLDVGATDIEGLAITVGPGIEIPGRVQWEGSAPGKDADLRVALRPSEEDNYMFMRGGMAEVKADGKFTLKNVPDGEYRIRVFQSAEDCYLKSARSGGYEVLQDGITISEGKIPGPLEVVLNCSGGVVEGVVFDDQQQPATGARVVLAPEGDRRSQTHLFKSTSPDQYGHFVINGLAPGDYKLFAWEEVEPGAYEDPEFLKKYEGKGKPLQVAEGARQSVQLQLIPAEKSLE